MKRFYDGMVRFLSVSIIASTAVGLAMGGPLDTWESRSSGATNDLHGMAYGSGRFVAVGGVGTIVSSMDGVAWATQQIGSNSLYGVTYGNGLFVAVGDNGTILTSSDGFAWTGRDAGLNASLRGVAAALGSFVAVGGSAALYSVGADAWSYQDLGSDAYANSVVYGNQSFVAVGGASPGFHALVSSISSSADGQSWTRQLTGGLESLAAIAYGAGQFVAVGATGDPHCCDHALVRTLDQGLHGSDPQITAPDLHGVAYGNHTFVAVGDNGVIASSLAGSPWVVRRIASDASSLYAVAFGGGTFVAVGGSGMILQSGYVGDDSTPPLGKVEEEWSAAYSALGTGPNDALAAAVSKDGSVFLTGLSSGVNSNFDFVTIKYAPDGNELWIARNVGPTNGNIYSVALALDSAGNAFIAGAIADYGTNSDWNGRSVVVKYDTNGHQLWMVSAPMGRPPQLAIDAADNVLIAGDTNIIKYDANGNLAWTTVLDPSVTGLALDDTGNAYTISDIVLTKVDPNGNYLWDVLTDAIPGFSDGYSGRVAVDHEGNAYIARRGTAKFDPSGNLLWSVPFPIGDPAWGYVSALALDDDGKAYISASGPVANDAVTVKYDSTGRELWHARFTPAYPCSPPGVYGSLSVYPRSVSVGADGSVYALVQVGCACRYCWPDYVLLKYDPAGNLRWEQSSPIFYTSSFTVDPAGSVYIAGSSLIPFFGVPNTNAYQVVKYHQVVTPGSPTIEIPPGDQVVSPGTDAVFSVGATGAQPLTYQWLFNALYEYQIFSRLGYPQIGSLKIGGPTTNAMLVLKQVEPEDAGDYSVMISNATGWVLSPAARLTVSSGAASEIISWRPLGLDNSLPEQALSNAVAISANGDNQLALNRDGTVLSWSGSSASVLPGLSNILAIAAGASHGLALQGNHTVVAWGDNTFGQTNVPALKDVVAISAGGLHNLALIRDGTVVAWGDNSFGQIDVPAGLSTVVAVAAGGYHSLVLINDGTVRAWGAGQSNTGISPHFGQSIVPPDLSGVVAIAAAEMHSLALKRDGTVVAWGDNSFGQTNVPAAMSNVVAVAAGSRHSLALKADGTVAAWGEDLGFPSGVPSGLTNVVGLAGGDGVAIALKAHFSALRLSHPGWTWYEFPATFEMLVATERGRSYRLESTESIGNPNWGMQPPIPGDGTVRTIYSPMGFAPQQFFRVRLQ